MSCYNQILNLIIKSDQLSYILSVGIAYFSPCRQKYLPLLLNLILTIKAEVVMVKKILAIPLLCLSMVFLMQCSNEELFTESTDVVILAGKGPGGGGGGGGGGHTEPVGNNLSFPVFALDGITISSVIESFTVPYTGPYTGLTDEELAIVTDGDWYAQKVAGNVWQAEYFNGDAPVNVAFIDWGDVIESSNPVIGRPFRLETTLYVDISDEPMSGYTMALLAYPSSPDETQGTNTVKYDGNWATIASSSPTLIIQYLENGAVPTWSAESGQWTGTGVNAPLPNFTFAPELNVGGKYIYGASTGGWRPTQAGTYRLTFFMRGTTNVNLSLASIGNYAGNVAGVIGTPTYSAATPVVDAVNNLSYVDVTVVSKRTR